MKHIVTLICAAAVLPSLCGQQLSSYMDFGTSFPQVSTASISTNSGGTFVADNLHETIDADPGPDELWLNPGAVNGAFVAYVTASGQWQWAQFIPTNSLSNVYVECKADEGYVISGGYYGEVDFDPGAGEYLLNSNGSPGLYAASYTATGELQWAISLTGSGYNTLYDMTIDNNGNVLLGGYFQETLDLDPGSGEWSVTANDSDFFIVKLDSSGNFIWALALGGDMYDYVRWIDTDSQQNVVVSGVHRSVVDMDPGAGELLLSPADEFSESNFMAKYDANGNLLWAHTIGLGTGSGDESELCQVDSDDNVLWAGWYAWNIDFDPGVGEAWVADSDFAEGWFVVKYLPDGTFSWVISGPGGYVQALT
ncbi:MAG: hypothetical protein JNM00_09150, partial [Flavobacteriales bacterium]|nr:hypothetical protein [Flavobacteriales bacterium]